LRYPYASVHNLTNGLMNNSKLLPEDKSAIIKWCVQSALGLAGYALIIFLAAGTFRWVWGWVFIGILAAFLTGHVVLLVPIDPQLLVERSRGLRRQGVKTWDKRLMPLAGGVFPVAGWIIAGLDYRFEWSVNLPTGVHLTGALGMALGYALFLWAMVSNAFFSEGVCIQEERGHTVAKGGPYRYVRHPGYTGAILSILSSSFLLGSFWSLIPNFIAAFLYAFRTLLEDKTLAAELPGYLAYTQTTRYRLLPGIW
jgi:protein-S-isoprenylcysteine O-methyltransferase Ste14